jgi:CheY-like chemotaxis protein
MMTPTGNTAVQDAKRRVLVVEDEMMVAMLIEDVLTDNGFEIAGFATNVAQALELVGTADFDAAVLDLNLAGVETYPIATELTRRGIPFVFSTGYGAAGLNGDYKTVPVVQKPFEDHQLVHAVDEAIGR